MTKQIFRTFMVLSLLLQAACTGKTPLSEFYLLEPLNQAGIPEANVAADRALIALAPVRIPDYLNRPQLVTAFGNNTYYLDEMHRWAESLDNNMTRVMLLDLASLIPADVVLTTHHRAKQASLRLAVTVFEFHIGPQEQARLVVQWQVHKNGGIVISRQNTYRAEVEGDEMQHRVQALNQCLTQLNRDMAKAASSLLLGR